MQKKTLKTKCIEALEELKAQNIKALNVRKLTSITDWMIIATGRSSRHIQSIATKLVDLLKQSNIRPLHVEGKSSKNWVLIDLGDVVVHIMSSDARDFYQLEKLWS